MAPRRPGEGTAFAARSAREEALPLTSVSPSISERFTARLAPYLGAFNAEVWVKTVAKRDLSLLPEELTAAHVPALVEGLRPSLNTFIGRQAADELLRQILQEIH